MKFSENWLRTLVDPPADRAALCARLTMAGLEVEAITPIGNQLDNVVVGRIVECEQHPNADRLRVCKVDVGTGAPLQIVCGAPNARAGLVAPVATIGAKLPNGLEIKRAALRGVESAGMLCSAKELELSDESNGLYELPADAPIGTTIEKYLNLPDATIELKLTPNRPDCLGLRGLASEVGTLFGVAGADAPIATVEPTIATKRVVELHAPQDAPRFVGRVIEGVDATKPSPLWLTERLRRAGIRSISAIVDCTNYVMLELGQPLHAYDHDKLSGTIVARRAKNGETTKLLDGRDVTLDETFVVIADDHGAHGVAGVMGGELSKVTDDTKNVFLEAAHFTPPAIVGRARKLGLHTDASHRFERGVDPELPRLAIERITRLLLDIVGGQPGPIVEAVSRENLPKRPTVVLRASRLARVLGIDVPDEKVEAILHGLGMDVTLDAASATAMIDARVDGARLGDIAKRGAVWRVVPPTRRFDIEREEDLIEEVARVHGYDEIPTATPSGMLPAARASEHNVALSDVRRMLVARGYREALEFSFVAKQTLAAWQLEGGAIPLANPLSADLAVMRTAILPGLVQALSRNLARQQERVRLFEIGTVFSAGEKAPIEAQRIAGAVTGHAAAEQWGVPRRPIDFHDVKGDLEQVLALVGGGDFRFDPVDVPYLHPGRSAELVRGAQRLGVVGALHPRLAAALGFERDVYVFELDLEPLIARDVPAAGGLSRFPSVRRDLALVIDRKVPYAAIEAAVRRAVGPHLRAVTLFDEYTGPGLSEGTRSLAIGLILQDDSRTLTDSDAERATASAVEALGDGFGARLRN